MVIIPICIFTIAYREKVSALGDGRGKEQAMDMLRIVFCSAYLAVGCALFRRKFRVVVYAMFIEQWSEGDHGVVGCASIVELLICTYFYRKVQAVTMKQTQSE